ncbi:hypothetical protein [Nocardioides humi]|uniref:Uncharacterized protein n=1 Tax=Nocardioides humi TaxID=449461 RepID=A0ABN2BJQ7_9ACTN|nr:hypothetical protein [Nocardioides humi]
MTITTHRPDREARQQLADRLMLEYAGSVAPGQVLAAVLRADLLLAPYHATPAARLTLCETLVRSRLTERVARRRHRSG